MQVVCLKTIILLSDLEQNTDTVVTGQQFKFNLKIRSTVHH